MSDERAKTDDADAPTGSTTTDPAPTADGPPPAGEDISLAPTVIKAGERVDEDGLPLDRPATLDDVRSDAGSGRVIAIGCTFLVIAVLGLFWLIRGGLLR